jgi:hypothetical protein
MCFRCHEAAFNVLATPIRTAKQLGYHFDSRVLDIENVDLATGKMMDQVIGRFIMFPGITLLAVLVMLLRALFQTFC